MIINKKDYPEVFIENEEMTKEDLSMFEDMLRSDLSEEERLFFERMKEKEEGEFAPSADLIMNETDNLDELYIIRYYYDEYKIGRGCGERRSTESIYASSLSEALRKDLFPLLKKHITLIEWLRSISFKGINYNGNFILNR